ncbi:MAG: hypothetical protein A2600_08650 [Candidatus Lambdaproteobacteria bacterium RIFOXYD1_FULL_56_27]|uniref:Uncharacterized protein TP-0789 domain-containing protein n=1 Tax=Candidatus Lambdaproteobacteria bacterium RIFOXYD2_FULL_56_26 TaxID=1817773 RepID=A0A1F6GZ19_9PROT|nr:MAG: hypothetical protein A2426_10070 [Candidatus Lambdaproteobacteria bacterium RIFOXYC1_FULL_56_13]OGH03395.1 MAG: hypothetical protein A2557_02615 [Candidatus Lambdaproteobacteria bacterium RIFOXYD2_FULL_56_26]OGH06600.1 MAG: hypothetical protein A2600_08650 [Candidatus Lambdaproteobacteria bacterium RIFOXYD1_FULL_56_27]
MKKTFLLALALWGPTLAWAATPTARQILERMDKNTFSQTQVSISTMTVHGERGDRNMTVQTWTQGKDRSFSLYLAPARDKGTKMLKLGDKLWIYYPSADKVVAIAGHMLKNSMMGSDLSYEDLMENSSLVEAYEAQLVGEETLLDRKVWVLELTAKEPERAYQKRKLWVDQQQYLALRQELFAQSGMLLKRIEVKEVMATAKGWYPKRVLFKDVLKTGLGTQWQIEELELDPPIPASRFNKSSLGR